jgi:hypothetical protein
MSTLAAEILALLPIPAHNLYRELKAHRPGEIDAAILGLLSASRIVRTGDVYHAPAAAAAPEGRHPNPKPGAAAEKAREAVRRSRAKRRKKSSLLA